MKANIKGNKLTVLAANTSKAYLQVSEPEGIGGTRSWWRG